VLRNPARAAAARAYAIGLRARYGRTGMPWRVHSEIVRIDPGVRYLVPHSSEPALFEFIKRHVSGGDTVLDVGSFLGIYAVLEARFAGPRGRVVAIEPTPWSASMARRHIEFNAGATSPIVLVEAAAGAAAGQAALYEYAEPYVNALERAVDVSGPATRRAVQVVTIDDLCREMKIRPTFIRMDVQGAEFHALRGARRTIEAAGPGLTIVAEMHPQCWPAFGIDGARAGDIIASLGLRAAPLVPGTDLFARDGHVVLTAAAT
jgi:FkbM family methyltransferase